MRYFHAILRVFVPLLFFAAATMAQETTGGIQGMVKDPSGAVVPNARVTVTGSTLVGSKEAETDAAGYYHFANLPPGSYTLTVTAKGFKTVKREGLILEVGHLPSVDFALEVGVAQTVVEVTSETIPLIDPTTSRTMTNVTEEVISYVPHGESFQSILQFAPSARNEPLMGGMGMGTPGTGGCSPTGCTNGYPNSWVNSKNGTFQYIFPIVIAQDASKKPLSVSPGQTVSVSVAYINNNTAGQISFGNVTTGQNFSITLQPPPTSQFDGKCVEWIMEAPGTGEPGTSLPKFSTVNFTSAAGCAAGGVVGNPQNAQIWNIVGNGKTLTSASVGNDAVTITFTG